MTARLGVNHVAIALSKREEQAAEAPLACHASACVLEDWLGFLGHRWNALIMYQLSAGPRRFSELAAVLTGITPKVLTERLQALAERGLIERSVTATFPRTTDYELTQTGREIGAMMVQMWEWAEKREGAAMASGQS